MGLNPILRASADSVEFTAKVAGDGADFSDLHTGDSGSMAR